MASHRLIQHVGKKYGLKVSEALYDALNVYYFVDGHALNDRPRLAQVAAKELAKQLEANKSNTGADDDAMPEPMSEEDILEFLNGTEGRQEIEMARRALDELGVHGIPKFIVEGRTVIDGAARSDTFVDIFRAIEARGEVAGGPVFAEILGVSPEIIERGSHSHLDVEEMVA